MEYDVYYFGRETPVRRRWSEGFAESVRRSADRWGVSIEVVPAPHGVPLCGHPTCQPAETAVETSTAPAGTRG